MRILTRSSIRSPSVIAAGVALIIILGIIAAYELPVQLFPRIERPQIGIETDWRAQTPREVEAQLIEPEEQVLQGIPGLQHMEGHANFGGAYINLTFALGTDMQNTLTDVIGRLNRVQTLPQDAQKPLAQLSNTQDPSAALLSIFVQRTPGNANDITSYERFVRDTVVPKLHAVAGVGSVAFTGDNTTDELQIDFDPMRAAQLNIQIPKVAFQIGTSDDISGGTIDVGRRKYGLSFRGRYSLDGLKDTILDWREGNPITLGDIATVAVGQAKRQGFAYHNGQPALQINVFGSPDTNVLATVAALKAQIDDINNGVAKDQAVVLQYAADPTPFVHDAIGLVVLDVALGIFLAIVVLWFFTREFHALLIVSSAIPISVCAVMIILQITGRSLNLISLAGLAVASGMVLDAAIVVLENILRMREAGRSPEDSAHDGTHQVWRALLASTTINVAIFLPVAFIQDVQGQLFADLAIAIAVSILVSLIVAITVVPVASTLFIKTRYHQHHLSRIWGRITDKVMELTDEPYERRLWIGGLITASVLGTWLLLPSVQYLPEVRHGVIDVSFQYPAGATVDFAEREVAKPVMAKLAAYTGNNGLVKDWYVRLATPGYIDMALFMRNSGAQETMRETLRNDILKNLPDTVSFASDASLFSDFDEGGGISINIQSADVNAMRAAARVGFEQLNADFPDASITTQPTLDYDEPQLELVPNDRAIAEAGWSRLDIANLTQALGEGLYIGQRFDDGEQLYLIFRSLPLDTPSALQNTPVATPVGGLIPFGNLVSVRRTLAPSGIYTLDGAQTYTLNFRAPQDIALSDALNKIETQIEPKILSQLPADGTISYGAAADHLDDALKAMRNNFAFAVMILFLIMAATFRSLIDALIAIIALPLGMVGGVIALRIIGLFTFQPLDLVTMIGFLVVLGLAVNNTILLVTRTREAEIEGMSRQMAVRSSLETRLRPIFSTTLTAVFGMLPLMLIPGPGSEIYRGLATVIVGGVIVSNAFIIFLIPAMLQLGQSTDPKDPVDAPAQNSGNADGEAAIIL